MADPHVISALKDKRARLSGELRTAQLRVIRLKCDIASVDQCLKLLKAEIDPEAIPSKRTLSKNPAGLPKGAGGRYAIEVLREAGEPLYCQEIARRVLERLGKEAEPKALAMLARTIHITLSRQKRRQADFDRSTWPGTWRLSTFCSHQHDLHE